MAPSKSSTSSPTLAPSGRGFQSGAPAPNAYGVISSEATIAAFAFNPRCHFPMRQPDLAKCLASRNQNSLRFGDMKSLADALTGNFIIANLGCIGDTDYHLPPQIVKCLTVIEVDAAGAAKTRSPYHKKLVIDRPISGAAGKFTFVRNSFAGSSSLLRPRNGIVEAYGMERYFRVAGTEEVECETLPILLRRSGLGGLDFLKTDVEGLDAAIIRSCQDFLGRTLALQCELRFEPFYETEPCFHEVASLLAGHGYEVLDITFIDRWKHKTPHREAQLEGRAVWGDFLFFLKPDQLLANFGESERLVPKKPITLF